MNQEKPSVPATFVTTINPALIPQLLRDLQEQGFDISVPPHTYFSAKKKGVSCTAYLSGKFTVQGQDRGEFIEFYLEPKVLQDFPVTHGSLGLDLSSRIGIDESGKGDFFGPLCVAGVYGDKETIPKLVEMGVKDSKTLTDSVMAKIGEKIRRTCPHHIVKINPLKYNELIVKFGNLNKLLAWGHATVIELLSEKTGCQRVILDQFANETVVLTAVNRKNLKLDITQRHRGEEDVVVAAASILARCAFVEGLEQLGKQFGIKLPKGASHLTITAGKRFVVEHGQETLRQVGKVHFKTLDAILGKKSQ